MTEQDCERTRDILPLLILGELDPEESRGVERHLASCASCRGEEAALRAILATRPETPADLSERIQARVREELGGAAQKRAGGDEVGVLPFSRRRTWVPVWALPAAAVVILSLGIGVIWNGEDVPEVGQDPIQVVAEEPIPESWLWDDGMVAGAPVFDGLTDEQLETLIQEMER